MQKDPNRQVQMPIQKKFTLHWNIVVMPSNWCNVILLGHRTRLAHQNPEFIIIYRKVPLRFAPTVSEVAFTSNWRVPNSSQLVNNTVLNVIEALDTAPKHTDKFENIYFASTICSTTPKKIKIGDITYICLFPSNISIRGSKGGQERLHREVGFVLFTL